MSGLEPSKISSRARCRASGSHDIVDPVPVPDHARLTLVLDLRADPIAGVVLDGDGDGGEPFAGWMELTRAIERRRDAARRADQDRDIPLKRETHHDDHRP